MKLIYGMFFSGYLMTASLFFRAMYYMRADESMVSGDYVSMGVKLLVGMLLLNAAYIIRRESRKIFIKLCVTGLFFLCYSVWSAGEHSSFLPFSL